MPSKNRGNALSGGQAPFVGAKPRGPAGALSTGSHSEELQLQQEIGNQAAMSAVSPPALGYMNESALTIPPPASASSASAAKAPGTPRPASAGSRTVPPIGAGLGPVMPTPKPAPRPDLPMPLGYMNESALTAPAPAPASASSVSASSPSASSAAKPLAKSGPASAEAEQQAASSYGVYRGMDMPSVSSAVPGNNPDFQMKPMVDGMQAFDTVPLGPQKQRMKTDLKSTTHYMDTPEKRANHSRGFDEQGKMINKTDGNALNTIGAEQAAMQGSKPDRHIFAMDGQGEFHSADALKENRTRGAAAKEAGLDQQERFHHSSFLGGEEVAGAGELQVRDGQVELVSDTSGHYQPGSKQMMQTVQQLGKNNVSMEKLGVEFVGKGGNENMQASALELLGYADHKPEQAETQMRNMHGKKNSFLKQIKSMGGEGGKNENLKPSQMKRLEAEAANDPKNGGVIDSGYDVYS